MQKNFLHQFPINKQFNLIENFCLNLNVNRNAIFNPLSYFSTYRKKQIELEIEFAKIRV